MKSYQKSSSFKQVLIRELQRMTSRRIYLGACVVLPLFSLFFMATIFGEGSMNQLPIGIVDKDNTSSSRAIVRAMEAVPTFNVEKHFINEIEARKEVQQKKIYGYLSIPHNFEQDAITGKDATLNYYYHYALMAVGGEIMGAFGESLMPIAFSPIALKAIELGVDGKDVETMLSPIDAQDHPVYNPSLNYSIYLSQPFFFVLFQILILLITVYVVGGELRFHSAHEWLKVADNNIVIALCGKLIPYTIIFSIEAIAANVMIFDIYHIPFEGSWMLLSLISILFVIATQALAIFVYSIYPALAIIISIISMIGSLGATLSGITFPIDNMFPIIQWIGALLPIRHFSEFGQIMFYTNAGFVYLWLPFVILLIYPILALFMLPRLKKAIINGKYNDIE